MKSESDDLPDRCLSARQIAIQFGVGLELPTAVDLLTAVLLSRTYCNSAEPASVSVDESLNKS